MSIEPNIISLSKSGLPEYELDENLTASSASGSTGILVSTLWNQSGTIYVSVNGSQTALSGYTYNQYCPTPTADSTSRTLTGCTNTADSQILYYWIEKGYDFTFTVSTDDYFQLNDESTTKYYVSDTPSLNEGSLTTLNSVLATTDRIANGDFIAALNFYCGVKNHSSYGTEATSTTWWYGDYTSGKSLAAFVAAGFDSYHFISRGENSTFYDNSGLTDAAFSVIRENLDYGEIIRVGVPGHAIFMDGYRWNDGTNEYEYHLNYGWGIGSSATTWYTVSQLRTTNKKDLYAYIEYIAFDLSPDIKVNVTTSRNDYWGGSFLRGMERINNILNEKNTVFAFDDSIAGESIELNQTFTVQSEVGLDFQNLNVELSTTSKYLISSSHLLNFELTGGSMTVNASDADTVVVESGNQAVSLSLDNSYVFIGNYSGGVSGLNTLLRDDHLSYTDLDSSFYASVSGNAVTAGSADDQIMLSNKSAVFGNLSLGGGSNVLSVENGSLFYGDFSAEGDSLRVELHIGEDASVGPMIVLKNRASENSFFSASGGKLNVTIEGLLNRNREYVLFQGTSSGLAQNFTVNLFDDEKQYVLDKNHQSADNYTLICENDKISLGYQLAPPEVLSVSADITTFTNKDVTLTATFSKNSNYKYYSFDGQDWQIYPDETGVVLTENATVYFKSAFEDLESEVVTFTVDWIDKVPPSMPVITADITERTAKDVTLTVTYDEAVAVNEYSLDGTNWYATDEGKVVRSENGMVYFRGTDMVGNVSPVGSYEVSNIDRSQPDPPEVTADITEPTDQNVILTAVYSADSLVKEYSMNSRVWLPYSGGGVEVKSNRTVFFRGINDLGTLGKVTAYEVTNIHKVGPEPPVVSADITTPTNGVVTLSAVYSEPCVEKEYSMNGVSWLLYADGVAVSENQTVYFRGADEDGVYSEVTAYEVTNIDKVPPDPPVVSADITEPTRGTVTLTAVYSDDTVVKEYSMDIMHWEIYIDGVTVIENGTVYFRAIDEAGNISKPASYVVDNIIGEVVSGAPVKVYSSAVLVKSAGVLTGEILEGGGNNSMSVSRGGKINITTVESGGRLHVLGGLGLQTTVNSQGFLHVSGGSVDLTQVNEGGRMNVSRGGSAVTTTIHSNGLMYVLPGGSASGTVVESQGKLYVSGGRAADTTVDSGGILHIFNGGTADFADIYSGGELGVFDGGTANSATVNSGGSLYAYDGGTANSATVNSGGSLYAYDGGTVNFTAVDSGGILNVFNGGTANTVTVNSGGFLHVFGGGTVNSATVDSNGSLRVYSGGKVTGTLEISSGGSVYAEADGEINADLTARLTSDAPLINDIKLICGDPSFTITVSASQAEGTYKLAGGLDGFSPAALKNWSASICTTDHACASISVGETVTLGGLDYTLNLNAGLLALTVSINMPGAGNTVGDLNADGRADIVMTIDQGGHPADGSTGAWLIQENQTAEWGDLSMRDADWEIFGTGKTIAGKNGDDVYIKSSENMIGAWTTGNDGKVNGWKSIGSFSSDTQIVGLGDFNGNGQSDLLLRAASGAVGCYFTDGQGWNYFQSLGDEWKLSAIGDLNGDGRDDMVLKHDAGFAGSWLTQEDGTPMWADLDTLPDGFEIVGAGDFNGDGTDDVLLQNGSYFGAWLIQNGNAAGWMGLGDLGDATVEQIADFNGDGVDDLRIRTAEGNIGAELVMGADTLDWHYYGSVGSEWKTGLAALS